MKNSAETQLAFLVLLVCVTQRKNTRMRNAGSTASKYALLIYLCYETAPLNIERLHSAYSLLIPMLQCFSMAWFAAQFSSGPPDIPLIPGGDSLSQAFARLNWSAVGTADNQHIRLVHLLKSSSLGLRSTRNGIKRVWNRMKRRQPTKADAARPEAVDVSCHARDTCCKGASCIDCKLEWSFFNTSRTTLGLHFCSVFLAAAPYSRIRAVR